MWHETRTVNFGHVDIDDIVTSPSNAFWGLPNLEPFQNGKHLDSYGLISIISKSKTKKYLKPMVGSKAMD